MRTTAVIALHRWIDLIQDPTLHALLDDYEKAVRRVSTGRNRSFSEIEIPKLRIADMVLEALGLPTGPPTPR